MTFAMNTDASVRPFPAFAINDQPGGYKPKEVDPSMYLDPHGLGAAEEWVITNAQFATHPLHIHVNSFVVKESVSGLEPDSEYTRIVTDTSHPGDVWRDTVCVRVHTSIAHRRVRTR